MILTDSMLAAAFRFRATEPWSDLCDSDVFAVRLSTGEIGYCSIMGHEGQHHALGLYIGEKGFSTYLKTLSMSSQDIDPFKMHEIATSFDCINCDFMNADGIIPETKKVVKAYAASNNIKVPRPYGWPDFTRFNPYKMQWHITNKEDGLAITEALQAATYMVGLLKEKSMKDIGFDLTGNYPTVKGGKIVPFLIPLPDGSYQLSATRLPAFCKDVYTEVSFKNDILIHRIKNLKAAGTLECQFIHLPCYIRPKGDNPPTYPGMILCVEANKGYAFPPVVTESTEDLQEMLTKFANTLSSYGHPSKILVCDDFTKNLLSDFCQECGINLKKQITLPELDEARNCILNQLM